MIFVYFYKDGKTIVDNDIHQSVMAGNAIHSNSCGFIGDDTGDSISQKNLFYSELTGIYWAWKNTDHDIVGSCHYRRYFTIHPQLWDYSLKRFYHFLVGKHSAGHGFIKTSQIERYSNRVINKHEVEELFKEFDVILPKHRKFNISLREHYIKFHCAQDLDILASIISDKYPEYSDSFEKMLRSNRLYANNMFILKRADHDKFMTWLFDILFEFEKRINTDSYTGYQQRIFGFLAERLLTTYFLHHNYKIKELKVIYFRHLKFQ